MRSARGRRKIRSSLATTRRARVTGGFEQVQTATSVANPQLTQLPRPEHELGTLHAQLTIFAREVGELYAAERARSRELEHALQGVQDMYVATMKALAQVVEAKDTTTRGHLDRTQLYGLALARKVDPELAERPEVAYGFFLHDIGKVGVPERILCKPGALTEEEWEVMRAHPAIGAQIVEPIRFLAGAVDIVVSHHEWYDGSGYPRGLRGRQIPAAARIFSIADCFDAMTSDRPYRLALPVEDAIAEIREGAGTQFDPVVVEAFLELVEDEDLLAAAGLARLQVAAAS
jgi:HD-GYP domain-containing protein (c-di-GMP phosphodiesterase class II)